MSNFRAKVITTPKSKREQDGSEIKRFCGISEDNKINQFTARVNPLTNVLKDNYIVVSNARITARGNKLSVTVGPTTCCISYSYSIAIFLRRICVHYYSFVTFTNVIHRVVFYHVMLCRARVCHNVCLYVCSSFCLPVCL